MRNYSRETLTSLYQEKPATQISKETGTKLYRIYRDLHASGIEVRPRGRRPVLVSPGREVLQGLLALGFSQKEVGKQLGVSKRTIQRWLKQD